MPTLEHFPISKREGGKKAVENATLAHRLCNRIDYSISVGRSYASDLERIRKAREDAIRRNKDRTRKRESRRPDRSGVTPETVVGAPARKLWPGKRGIRLLRLGLSLVAQGRARSS